MQLNKEVRGTGQPLGCKYELSTLTSADSCWARFPICSKAHDKKSKAAPRNEVKAATRDVMG